MRNTETTPKISTGSLDLDKWLSGGYDRDIITTICGPAGSGKTNFCILAAANSAKNGKKVIFIDTEGGFSVDRLKQIFGIKSESAISNILLLKPTTFDEQWNSFGQLLKELKSGVDLIIVDGMTMLYRLEIAEANNEKEAIKNINGVLARQMRILAEIARKRKIPVLVTNQVYSEFLNEDEIKSGKERAVNMVGGDILKYWSKCIIELKNNRGKRTAIIKKHRSIPEKEINFEIFNEGIRRKGWL